MSKQIFISHSVTDKEIADTACAVIESAGWKCWIAPRDIVPGSDWSEAIIDAINSSDLMLLIYSESAGNSLQIKREVERAASRGISIIPFRIENTPVSKSLEYFLSTAYWIDALKPERTPHLQFLKEVVEKTIGKPEEKIDIPRRNMSEEPPSQTPPRKKPKRKFLRSRMARIFAAVMLLAIVAGGIYLAIARPWQDARSFDTMRNQCQQYLNEQQFDTAVEECKKTAEKDPSNPLGHRALGVAYHARAMQVGVASDLPRAVASLSEAIRLDPTDAHALYMRGLAYIAQNENSNALKDFLAALKLDNPGQQRESELYYNCGIAYFGLKKYDYSLESLNRAIELYQHPDIYLALNKTLFEMGKYKEAAERLTEAIDFDPNYRGLYILYNERGKAYSKLKMEKEALKDYEEANRLFRQAQEQNNNAAR